MLFRRMRNQLLIMNLVFITIIMAASFTTIYLTTRNQIMQGIEVELSRTVDFRFDEAKLPVPADDTGTVPAPDQGIERFPIDKDLKERSVSFSVLVNTSDTIISVNSFYSEEDSFYEEALFAALADGKEEGTCSFADSRWAYTVADRFGGQLYGFVDIDERQAILDKLLLTFLGVSAGTLLLIFGLSYYLTQRSLKPAVEAFAKQKEFISHASHELKTPMAVIGVNTELLLDRTGEEEPTAEQKKRLEFMKTEVQRMGGLIKNLLFLASLDEGRSAAQGLHVPFDLSDAVESQLLGMEGLIFEKGHNLEYDVEPGLVTVGVKEQLVQVLTTLLDNAVKYADAKSTINVALGRQGNRLQLSVSNPGNGIPEEDLPRIFDRFYRGDAARDRSQSSYGLGLAIVKTIIDGHKGTIECRSEHRPGGITTFIVRVPAARK